MIKELNGTLLEVVHVVSEPGDATRYDYHVYNEYDNYYFIGTGNTFNYPGMINKYDSIEEVIRDNPGVNEYTINECMRTIKELNK